MKHCIRYMGSCLQAIYHICRYMHTLIIWNIALDTWDHASKQYIAYIYIYIYIYICAYINNKNIALDTCAHVSKTLGIQSLCNYVYVYYWTYTITSKQGKNIHSPWLEHYFTMKNNNYLRILEIICLHINLNTDLNPNLNTNPNPNLNLNSNPSTSTNIHPNPNPNLTYVFMKTQ